ncbi:type VII secretion target [Pseudonocardia sp. TRM90224]|uniref:type VII secretion target n=1 Tax=Pseudonocardia sp. TRM90224 TaxID=2812678 RepID=UPI001E64C7C9|nr:type VII secretion target [Pseudonocardia sp. TRM90224]
MTAGFGVDPAALVAHAADVDAIAGRVRRAAEAAAPLDQWAYGLLGQVFAAAATTAVGAGSAAIDGVAGVAEDFGNAVRESHDVYLGSEDGAATSFRWPG